MMDDIGPGCSSPPLSLCAVPGEAAGCPQGLGESGRVFWQDVIDDNGPLRADRMRVLFDAARIVDLIERMHAESHDEPLQISGSRGQVVAHPVAQEIRAYRHLLVSLIGQLRLGQRAPSTMNTDRGRAMARRRWGSANGTVPRRR